MLILGIETSCDETACAVIEKTSSRTTVLSNTVSSQIKLHSKWGGVVPNLAAREHLKNIIPVLRLALKNAGVSPVEIDLISVTQGPGLIPALLIGVDTAKALSYIWKKPLLGIQHIEGHIYANFISHKIRKVKGQGSKVKSGIKFPILCLVVSGGHTQLVLMRKHLDYEIVGQTLDDAAGEAFDKVARILKLGYPGGPAIARRAMEFPISKSQPASSADGFPNKFKISLPRPMINSHDLNFSFSGLKTAVLYKMKEFEKLRVTDYELLVTAMAYEFQQAAVDVLVSKTIKAAKKYNPKTILLAGGVSANQELRRQLGESIDKNLKSTSYRLPVTDYCIDNAAMIAAAAYYRWSFRNAKQKKSSPGNWKKIAADANLKLNSKPYGKI